MVLAIAALKSALLASAKALKPSSVAVATRTSRFGGGNGVGCGVCTTGAERATVTPIMSAAVSSTPLARPTASCSESWMLSM